MPHIFMPIGRWFLKNRIRRVRALNVVIFIFAISQALLGYIISSYLAQFVGSQKVGFVFTAAFFLTLLAINILPKSLANNGVVLTSLVINIVAITALIIMAFVGHIVFAIAAFMAYQMTRILTGITYDILLERNSIDATTGGTRGWFLTFANLGWVISPVISGFLLENYNYTTIFTISAILIIPIMIIIASNFKFKTLHILPAHKYKVLKTFKQVYKNKCLFNVFALNTLLRFFYSVMLIYTPIYLNQVMGFAWSSIGMIFTVMLFAFILVELPAGKIADKWLGEKELMTAGIIIASIFTISIFFIQSMSLVVWMAVLFGTRVGAALIEAMSETHFFKHVDGKDINFINFFRNSMPIAYILSPLIFSIVLIFLPMQYVFLILGIFMLTGLYFSLRLVDTK